MRPRAWLACLFALCLGVALSGGGCANGSSETSGGGGGGDDSGAGDSVVDAAGDPAACASPKTACGGACTNLQNDSKNCGRCGDACPKNQVCNSGRCDYACTPPLTLCGLADAGAGDGSTEGGDAGADAGAGQPYCANLNDDGDNCGKCGHVCATYHQCKNGQCGLSCGQGQKVCIAGDTCIPTGTCCSSADCTAAGEVCPQPGTQCACPSGEKVCTKNNACISGADCCTDSDCTVSGSTCPSPGSACQCPSGQKACTASNTCIPQSSCCTGADCGPEPNVKDYSCTGGSCGIKDCNAGCFDLDGKYSNGCECCDDALGQSCGAATPEGPLVIGQSINVTGVLPRAGEEKWVAVSFTGDSTQKAYHPSIVLSGGSAGEFAFDIYASCGGAALACGIEGGTCTAKTSWDVAYGAQATGNPGDPNWQPIAAVGTVYVRVFRATGSATCDQFALAISD